MTTTEHFILIETKFQGPTNYRGAAVALTLPRWGNKRITRPWTYEVSGLENQVVAILAAAGITPAGFGEAKVGHTFFVPFDQGEAVRALFGVA